MRFIETPVQVIYTDDPRSEGGEPFIVDAYGYKMLLRGIGVGVGGLDDRAVEVARAINAHDALVEALEHMIPRYCEMFRECGLGDPQTSAYVQAAQTALRLAKGETE